MAKILEDMKSLGCNNKQKIQLAYQLYQQLCDTKLKWDVEYSYNEELDLIYLKAKESKNSEQEIFIPRSTSDLNSLEDIQNIQRILECPRITLAIMESDSTIVYYEFAAGFKNLQSEAEVMKVNCFSKSQAREKQYSRLRRSIIESIKPENPQHDCPPDIDNE